MRSAAAAITVIALCLTASLFAQSSPAGAGAETAASAGQAANRRTKAELSTIYLTTPWGRYSKRMAASRTQKPVPPDPMQHNEVSAQVSGVYDSRTFSHPVKHFDTNSVGMLLGYRYHFNDWEALEFEYGYTRNGQRYVTPPTTPGLPGLLVGVPASLHEFVGNEVLATPRIFGIFQPFVLAGGGALVFRPRSPSDITPVSTQTRGAFNFGFGFDFHIGYIGARIEYQGLVFKVPDFKNPALTVNKYSLVSQPSTGLIFTF